MLYIFFLNSGRIIQLDIDLVTKPVCELQKALAVCTAIPVDEQVLLVSGGIILEDPTKIVSQCYGAGTETNPIYLICRNTDRSIDVSRREEVVRLKEHFRALSDELTECSSLPTSFDKIQRQSALAGHISKSAEQVPDLCQRLADDQRLLHQGWLSLVTNLEDHVSRYIKRADRFGGQFERFVQNRDRAKQWLNEFDTNVKLLAKIPLLACLNVNDVGVRWSADDNAQSNTLNAGRRRACSTSDVGAQISLLDWIHSRDAGGNQLQDMANHIHQLLAQITDDTRETVVRDRDRAQRQLKQDDLLDIKGIEKRFQELNDQLVKIRECSLDVVGLRDVVLSSEQRALQTTRDISNMQPVCDLQRTNLTHMLHTFDSLTNTAAKFDESNSELLRVTNYRLKWIIGVYKELRTSETHRALYVEQLNALSQRLEVLRQVHDAPTMYATAVTEVVRRRLFSEEYNLWSSELVDRVRKVYQRESEHRAQITHRLKKHFVWSLFSCLMDQVPDFATNNPPAFDQSLPSISTEHLRLIRGWIDYCAPSLAGLLRVGAPKVLEELRASSQTQQQTHGSFEQLSRTDSFLSQTMLPGAGLGLGLRQGSITSFGGSAEQFGDFSPSSYPSGGLLAQSPLTQLYISPQHTNMNYQLGSSPVESGLDTTQQSTSSTIGSTNTNTLSIARSQPITIQHKPMEMSRAPQVVAVSGKSSHFGTPDEQIGRHSQGGSWAASPPVIISRSQVQQELGQQPTVQVFSTPVTVTTQQSQSLVTTSTTQTHENIQKDLANLCQAKFADFMRDLKLLREDLQSTRAFCVGWKEGAENESIRQSIVQDLCARLELVLQNNVQLTLQAALIENTQQHKHTLNTLHTQIEVLTQRAHDAEKLTENYEALVAQKDDVITFLEEKLESRELELVKQGEDDKAEIIKQLTIDYELQMDAMRDTNNKKLQSKENELSSLREQMEENKQDMMKMRKEKDELMMRMLDTHSQSASSIDMHQSASSAPIRCRAQTSSSVIGSLPVSASVSVMGNSPPSSADHPRNIRAELEKEYKDKLTFLSKGMNERQQDVLNRLKKEHEIQLRQIKDLHAEEINEMLQAQNRRNEENANVASATAKDQCESVCAEDSSMIQSVMMESVAVGSQAEFSIYQPNEDADVEGDGGDSPCNADDVQEAVDAAPEADATQPGANVVDTASNVVHCRTQTRLRMRDWDHGLVQMHDTHIQQGALVMVVWNQTLATYILLTTSQSASSMYYFVKERCVQLLGLPKQATFPLPANNTSVLYGTLARVLALDYCQIKKDNNRYNLPLRTKFYRVEVEKYEKETSETKAAVASPSKDQKDTDKGAVPEQ